MARLGSFHFISASFPIDEASQNAIPEKKKEHVWLRNNPILLCPLKKKPFFFQTSSEISKHQTMPTEQPSEMTFVDPSENLINGKGGGEL